LSTGLYRTDIVPRDPMHGRGPASYYRPSDGVGALLMPPTPTVGEDCRADLIPGVLTLSPQRRGGSRTRSRSSFPSIGCDTLASREPVYCRRLPTRTCAGRAVSRITGGESLIYPVSPCFATRSSPSYSLRSLRKGAPRYPPKTKQFSCAYFDN
jgi:hypothetical protein